MTKNMGKLVAEKLSHCPNILKIIKIDFCCKGKQSIVDVG